MKGFSSLAVLYLALPNILFLLTWINPCIGLPSAVIVAYCSIKVIKSFKHETAQKIDHATTIFVFCLALFWTVISGAGGLIPQFQGEDYIKQNLLFNDLIHKAWPVVYNDDEGGKTFLCYSVGYYLIPVFISQCLGAGWISVASFAWTFVGTWLFFFWVAQFNRKAPVPTLLLFLFFSGLGIIWFLLRNSGWREQLVPLGLYFNYPDWWTKVAFSPQYAMATWLGTALLYEMVWVHRNPRRALFIWSLTLLWSPFTALGLLLLPVLAARGLGIKGFMESTNIIGGGALLLIMGIYYKAHMAIADQGWIWSHANPNWFALYLLYVCIQILFSAVCIFLVDREYNVLQNLKPLFLGATLLLILLPIYKIGRYSDLRVQASGPLLVFVSLSAAACLTSEQFTWRKPLFLGLVFIYFIGAFYPATRPWYRLALSKHDYSIQNLTQSMGMADLSQLRDWKTNISFQYMGKTDSVAYKYLLKH